MYLKLGDTVLELVHIPSEGINQSYHFCIESNDFYADYKHLNDAGVPVETEPHPVGAREPRE